MSYPVGMLPTYSEEEKSRNGEVSWNALTIDALKASSQSSSRIFIVPDFPCSNQNPASNELVIKIWLRLGQSS